MKMKMLFGIVFELFFISAATAQTVRQQSAFVTLAADTLVNSTSYQTILSRTVSLSAPATLVAVADGRYFPVDAPAGQVAVAIDGNIGYSSIAVTDWGSSHYSVQHAFNAIANTSIPAGTHTVSLVASSSASRTGRFKIGSGSGLAIFVQPLSQISALSLPGESGNISLTTYNPPTIDITEGSSNRPSVTILSQNIANPVSGSSKVISLISGRSFNSCNSGINSGRGDASWGIYANGICQSTANASWANDDLDTSGELQGAMFAHSVYPLATGETKTISFRASELAFGSDQPNLMKTVFVTRWAARNCCLLPAG